MDSRAAAALLLLALICTGFTAAEVPVDCCLRVTRNPFPRTRIASYTIQEAGRGCDISATLFVTKMGKILCAVPASEEKWVQSHIRYLDRKKAHK